MNKKAIITLVGLAILTLGLLSLRYRLRPEKQPASSAVQPGATFEVGQKAADFEALDFNGNKIKLSDFAGKAIVLDYWAAWCPFCVGEMPALEEAHQKYKDEVVFIGIHRTDSGESIKRALEFAKDKGVTYTLVQDPTGEIYKMATKGINAMPTAVFIDKQGVVKEIKLGPKTKEEIAEKVKSLLEQNS